MKNVSYLFLASKPRLIIRPAQSLQSQDVCISINFIPYYNNKGVTYGPK